MHSNAPGALPTSSAVKSAREPQRGIAQGLDAIPETAAGRQLAWLIEVINAGAEPSIEELEARFDTMFLAQFPAAQLQAKVLPELAAAGPFEVESVLAVIGEHALAIGTRGKSIALDVSISVNEDGRIEELLFQKAKELPSSWAELINELEAMPGESQLLVSALEDGICLPLHELAPDRSLSIASTFKLYVLLALVDEIVAGKREWDRSIAIRDEWKSLPSGVLQDQAEGAELPILEYAKKMIASSDNTATDHLLYSVGRERVEAALRAGGHTQPERNQPFLSTREMFLLKLSLSEEDVASYLAMAPARRRRFLNQTLAKRTPSIASAAAWKQPRHIDELDWFASATDICRLWASLTQRAEHPKGALLLDIVATNPGVAVDPEMFPWVGYKGGSEPGVIHMTWLLRRADNRWFVVTLAVNNANAPVDQLRIVKLGQQALALLVRE